MGEPVAYHKLNRQQLLTLAIALEEQRDRALAAYEAEYGRVLRLAADALENQPPKLKHQYVSTLRLYADDPWRLDPCKGSAGPTVIDL
ncbi:hypothetical protein SEA_ZUCKER_39 [Arthrobacter phage Zucker]|nr:hypothetical protein SEA_ZUCKER_39 [Arthrobacter phage Zucker]